MSLVTSSELFGLFLDSRLTLSKACRHAGRSVTGSECAPWCTVRARRVWALVWQMGMFGTRRSRWSTGSLSLRARCP
jgi:hypothetical protein